MSDGGAVDGHATDGHATHGDDLATIVKGKEDGHTAFAVRAMTTGTWGRDQDLERAVEAQRSKSSASWWIVCGLAYRSLGIIYGDIGTSPLYIWPSIFSSPPEEKDVLGALCLLWWTLTIVTMTKYLFIVLSANDHGEGGTFAVYSLICRFARISPFGPAHASDRTLKKYSTSKKREPGQVRTVNDRVEDFIHNRAWAQHALLFIVIAGTCALIGDGIITPAVSVVSAVSGLQIPASLQHADGTPKVSNNAVIGISIAILILLFIFQRVGTSKVGFTFSPIVVYWYVLNGGCGIFNIVRYYPGVFKALAPNYGFDYFLRNHKQGWVSLGGVVLAITGTEAFFADLTAKFGAEALPAVHTGHFNVKAVRLSALAVVYPGLTAIYFGQAAFLIKRPDQIGTLYYNAIPHPLFWPAFVSALLAAIVASQAIITGSFSIIKQSMALNCFPRVTVIHKSSLVGGQIYIEEVNWALCLLGIAIIAGFTLNQGTPTVNTVLLSNAYGVAVLAVMVCTTCLVTLVIIIVWRKHIAIAVAFFCTFIFIEGIYFSSTLFKIPHGAWFPIAVAGGVFLISYLWKWGTSRRLAHSAAHGVQLDDVLQEQETPDGPVLSVIASGQPLLRAPGAAVYYADNLHNLPPAFVKLLSSFPTVHNVSIFLTIRQVPVPTVGKHERTLVREMPFAGFYRVVTRYGYMDEVDQGHEFIEDVLDEIERFLAAKVAALRHDDQADPDTVDVPTGGLALDFAKHTDPEVELGRLVAARGVKDVVYIRSRSRVTAAPGSNPFKRLLLAAYNLLYSLARSPIAASKIPFDSLCEIGIKYAI